MNIRDTHRAAWLIAFLMALSVAASAGQRTYRYVPGSWRTKPGRESHWSPDHMLRAVVIFRKPYPDAQAQSVVEIRTLGGQLLEKADYTTDGGSHGGTVSGAAWTSDGQFFVFVTTSSGGHSPSHLNIRFYSRRRHRIYYLDNALERLSSSHGPDAGDGYLTGNMELYGPCTLKTEGRINIDLPGVSVQRLKHDANDPIGANALTIDLGRLESVLTKQDEEYDDVTGLVTGRQPPGVHGS